MGRVATVYKNIGVSVFGVAAPFILGMGNARAETLTAGVALDMMNSSEFSAYTQGIIEGMAQARYEADGGTDGMRCIYEWYYGDQAATARAVVGAFDQYPDHSPGAVMSGLIRKECPE